jgi:hypothetical protein
MLTGLKPTIDRVMHSHYHDAYLRPRDFLNIGDLCEEDVERLIGVTLEPLESVRVWIEVAPVKGESVV